MLNYGFERFERRVIFLQNEFLYSFPLSNGASNFVKITNLSPIAVVTPKNAPAHTYSIEACFRFAVAPVQKGQIVAKLCVSLNGKQYTSTLICAENISAKNEKHSFFN
jgi:D-alanyl-D-alanine carboxypeptidase